MVKYNVTGSKRKKLVQKLSALTAQKPEYLGLPSMAFKVGPYIVTKNGTIEGDVPEPHRFPSEHAAADLRRRQWTR